MNCLKGESAEGAIYRYRKFLKCYRSWCDFQDRMEDSGFYDFWKSWERYADVKRKLEKYILTQGDFEY